MKYRKKPVVIEAIQAKWGSSIAELIHFAGKENLVRDKEGQLYIKTLEGNMKITLNDYIIKGVQGEFYPCKPDIFEATYERVDE